MTCETYVDGSFFAFPDGWELAKVDDWAEHGNVTKAPIHAKACDLVAVGDREAWLVEAKDYTYPGAAVPSDLHVSVGKKIWHTLALLHAVANWGDGPRRSLSRRVLACRDVYVCLAIELPDGGLRARGVAQALANQKSQLRKMTLRYGVSQPVIGNSFFPDRVPWTIRRDPSRRSRHRDR